MSEFFYARHFSLTNDANDSGHFDRLPVARASIKSPLKMMRMDSSISTSRSDLALVYVTRVKSDASGFVHFDYLCSVPLLDGIEVTNDANDSGHFDLQKKHLKEHLQEMRIATAVSTRLN